MGSTISTYDIKLPIKVHNPSSSGLNLLVTIITNMVPVKIPIIPTKKAISPEYVTRISLKGIHSDNN